LKRLRPPQFALGSTTNRRRRLFCAYQLAMPVIEPAGTGSLLGRSARAFDRLRYVEREVPALSGGLHGKPIRLLSTTLDPISDRTDTLYLKAARKRGASMQQDFRGRSVSQASSS
jgi:hypothetical protein